MTLSVMEQSAPTDDHEALIGLPTLMKMVYSGSDLTPLGVRLLNRAETHPDDANTLLDLSIILQFKQNRDLAMTMQAEALKQQQIYNLHPVTERTSVRLLVITGPGDLMANTPFEFLVEGADISVNTLYVGPSLPIPSSLPDHDVVFVAIGESEENRRSLIQLMDVMKSWPVPVLNMPDRIALLSRDDACLLLKGAPGIVMPATVRTSRQPLERIGRGEVSMKAMFQDMDFPIILRPVDSHAGRELDRIDTAEALAEYLSKSPENEFFIAPFMDYRSGDGQFRKYRIILIDGRPYVCHMAISDHWMIHYLNAGMEQSPEKRAEEARFMASFDDDFALRHQAAFQAITERTGLDYLGIDCGETPDGKLLIFEIDSNMIVHDMDPVDIFPYKQPQMQKLFGAFRSMLEKAANLS